MSDFSKSEKEKAAALLDMLSSKPAENEKIPHHRTRRRAAAQPKEERKIMAKPKKSKKGKSKRARRPLTGAKLKAAQARGRHMARINAQRRAAAEHKAAPHRKASKHRKPAARRAAPRTRVVEKIVEVMVPAPRRKPAKKPRRPAARTGMMHERGETVYANRAGEAVAPGKLGHLRAEISAHVPVMFDQVAIGAILDGFFSAMRAPASPDLSSMYPEYSADHHAQANWQKYAQEREIGRQLWKHIGMAMLHNQVSANEVSGYISQVWQGIAAAASRRPQLPAPGQQVQGSSFQ